MQEVSKYAYIAGPVTGLPDRNRPAFEVARLVVERITGARVTIPHDFVKQSDAETTPMVLCVVAICDMVKLGLSPVVVVLPGWRESAGSLVEVALARKLGVPVCELHGDELVLLSPGHPSEAARRATGETASDHANLGKETQT